MRILEFAHDRDEVYALCQRRRSTDPAVDQRVQEIVQAVVQKGDAALLQYTREFDSPMIDSVGLRVTDAEIEEAHERVTPQYLKALRIARRNIRSFHKRQLPASWSWRSGGVQVLQRFSPLRRVGLYVPGGKAAYPSTVLMNAIPAAIAGVPEIVMVTPAMSDGMIRPEVLVAASACGIEEMYRIGGAQAIAALAFGTETVRPVDKITGPGNAYVAAAKKLVFGRVGIDMIAGPTEVVIVADDTADPASIAADLIAQAEHDEDATAVCVCLSRQAVQGIEMALAIQLERAPRKTIAQRSLDRNGAVVVVETLREALDIVNAFAPEHLELLVSHPRRFARKVRHAGSIFLGGWAAEALGDYLAGPNHTLPTSGTARFSSPLSVFDFMKFTNVIECSKKQFRKLSPHVEVLADTEGLHGHAESIRVRRKHV